MLFDPPLAQATLIKRYQRFLADVSCENGEIRTLHCPNTGSMKHCNAPGSRVLFSDSGNAQRKYPCTLEAVSTPSGAWAGVNTSRANALVQEAIEQSVIKELRGYRQWQREVRYGSENSRIDLLLQQADQSLPPHHRHGACYVEVKNVTLEEDSRRVRFPDAVTARGSKHLRELMRVCAGGERAVVLFCVQHSLAEEFRPARDIDPLYAATLAEAAAAGVEVLAYGADISAGSIRLNRPVTVHLA